MKLRTGLVWAGALVTLLAPTQVVPVQAVVQPCPDPSQCAQVSLDNLSGSTGQPGGTLQLGLTFQQGPNDNQSGTGIDEIAALALTIGLPGTTSGAPLTLKDCAQTTPDLPAAVKPAASISNFNVVVENAYCTSTRTHCLCFPAAGQTLDSFINIVIYGPNPVVPPVTNIPTLPTGPQQLLTIDLNIEPTAAGAIALSVFNEASTGSNQRQHFTALASVGDPQAVDQTCNPVSGTPPCSDPGMTSQMAFTQSSVQIQGGCVGNCNYSPAGVTSVDLANMVTVALGTDAVTTCQAGDSNNDGVISITEIVTAVKKGATGCTP